MVSAVGGFATAWGTVHPSHHGHLHYCAAQAAVWLETCFESPRLSIRLG